jgi:hypothetical protein
MICCLSVNVLGVFVEYLQKYDSRPPVAEIKRQSEIDPKLGFAFRTAMDDLKSGKISRDELIRRLLENRPKEGNQ